MAKGRNKEPLGEEEKRALNKTNLKKLLGIFKYVLPYKGTFIAGMICLVFSSVTLLGFPFFAGKLLDVASGKEWIFYSIELNSINQITLVLILILVVQSIFSFLRVYLFAKVSERSMAHLRLDIFGKMLLLPIKFFDKNRVGELTSRVTNDVSMLQTTFSTSLAELFRQVTTLVVGTAIISYFALKLTLFMLLTFPVLVLVALIFGQFIRKLSKSTQDKLAGANIIVEETLQGVSVVKAFTNELLERSRYAKALNASVDVALKAANYRGAFISFIILILFGGIVGVLWFGANLVEEGEMLVGELLAFVLYTTFIGASIAGLGDMYGQLQRAIGASERLLEIIGEESEVISDKPQSMKLRGQINFKNVNFAYPERKDITVLKDLNLEIEPGSKVALVGPSGAGKSTIIQLISRFYADFEGGITIDGNTIDSYELSAYRKNIGIVPQEVMLFGGTIRENILYGNPNADEQAVTEAAKKANALEFINEFPEGMDTIVGERGVKLSGGQRQRIAIARAILKDPAILILDEATSSLDAESELLVQQALNTLMEGRTTIIIAHRLATIRQVDNIFVLKNGRITESGSHELLEQKENGIYRHLLRLQFQLS